jgi:hypothetical protein
MKYRTSKRGSIYFVRNANGQSHAGAFNAGSSNGAGDGSSVAQNDMKQKTPTGQENLQS